VTPAVAAQGEATGVERVFREVYGQAVATLIRIFGDITLAEDAVQEAFAVASAGGRATASRQPGGVDRDDRTKPRDR
jgi:Predicted RNA polymerase sigma factor containing a TPR repeat domain